MTNKQLLKRLQYQQNKLISIRGYSFHLAYFNNSSVELFFSISIHDYARLIIYNNTITIHDSDLKEKLKEFIDGLVNN